MLMFLVFLASLLVLALYGAICTIVSGRVPDWFWFAICALAALIVWAYFLGL
jgi:hypothetical protein